MHGFSLPNRRPGEGRLLELARDLGVSGRCGGLAFAALDYYFADAARGATPSTAEEPVNDRLSLYLERRSLESIVANGGRFVHWTLVPEERAWWSGAGLGIRTRAEELPVLCELLRDGPVPLGLVRATRLTEMRRNHQVVAYAVEMPSESLAVVRVYDPNHPLADDVRIVVPLGATAGAIHQYRGDRLVKTWRGFFVERYGVSPPPER